MSELEFQFQDNSQGKVPRMWIPNNLPWFMRQNDKHYVRICDDILGFLDMVLHIFFMIQAHDYRKKSA